MTDHVGLLRAVNVSGTGAIAMDDLRAVGVHLGFADVRTVRQTGNLLFRSPSTPARALEARLARALEKQLGITTDCLVRTADAWRAVLDLNPFPAEATSDPAHLLVVFLKERPLPQSERRLRGSIRGRERVRVIGAEAFVVYPDGIGRSRLTLPVLERAVGSRGTGRNWNTVREVARQLDDRRSASGEGG